MGQNTFIYNNAFAFKMRADGEMMSRELGGDGGNEFEFEYVDPYEIGMTK